MPSLTAPWLRLPLLCVLCAAFALGCQGDVSDEPAAPSDQPIDYAPEDTLVVTGTLLDATCHAEAEEQGGDPATCEGDYVVHGYPVGLRDDDRDTVWMLVTVPQALVDYLTSHARVTGIVRSRGVLVPQQIEVRDGDGWAAIL